ncbi:hypothetical protein K504DRAFT_36674 [Pleomassaria siparia CBS 279.74]|uniref:Uncharacterized protein n=1 Tax=Pleomassaria siparia CBS 279.74 TaxID=1314801 RepID=A0A6G1K4D8_9PLEO|nr:hypothetical protein K504DRAFT_36674 [Pleomassaria siparia CBS 279.74]
MRPQTPLNRLDIEAVLSHLRAHLRNLKSLAEGTPSMYPLGMWTSPSPYCESTIMNMNIDMGMNLDMNMNMNMNTNKNTDITHKEAGAAPHLWRRRSGQKRGPFARRYKQFTMAKQNGRFSNFGRSKPLKLDRGKGRAIPLSVRLSSGSPVRLGKKRGLSVAPSVPLRFAVSKPPNIKSVPNLDDTFSSPDIDSKVPRKSLGARRSASSRTPLRKAPAMSKTAYTVYTSSSSGQSLGHAAPSISSSMRGLYPSPSSSNMVPPFLTIRPVLAERSLSVPKTGLPHPPPQSSFDSTKSISKHPLITRSLLHTYSTPNLPVDMSWSSFPVTRSMTTAADDLSVHSSLDQRRMKTSSHHVTMTILSVQYCQQYCQTSVVDCTLCTTSSAIILHYLVTLPCLDAALRQVGHVVPLDLAVYEQLQVISSPNAKRRKSRFFIE